MKELIHESTFSIQGYFPITVRLVNPVSGTSFTARFQVNQELTPGKAEEIARSFAVGQNWSIDDMPTNLLLMNAGDENQFSQFQVVYYAAMGIGNLGPNQYKPSSLDSSPGVELAS